MQFFKRILNFDEATVARQEQRLAQRFPLTPESPLIPWLITAESRISSRLLDLSSADAGLVIPADAHSPSVGERCRIELEIEDEPLNLSARVARTYPHPDGIGVGLDLTENDYPSRRNLVQLLEPIEMGTSLKSIDRKSVSQTEPGLLSIRYFSSTSTTLTVWRNIENHEISGFEMRMHQFHVRSGSEPPELKLFIDEVSGGSGYSHPTLRPSGEAGTDILRLFNWVVPHLNPELPSGVRAYLQLFSTLTRK